MVKRGFDVASPWIKICRSGRWFIGTCWVLLGPGSCAPAHQRSVPCPSGQPYGPSAKDLHASHRVISCVRRAIESRRAPALQGVGHALGRPGTSTLIPTAHTTASPSVPPSCCPPRPGGNAAPLLSTLRMHLTPPPPLPSNSQADHRPPAPQSSARLASMLQPLTPSCLSLRHINCMHPAL